MITTILSLLKNKWTLYAAIALCAVLFIGGLWFRGSYYQGKYDKLIAKQNDEKVKIYEAFRKEADLHNERLIEIEKASSDTNKRIKGLVLQNEKCQNADYYNTANSIIDRLRK